MDKIWLVFLGGGIGSLVRYSATLLSARVFGTSFPWGTAIVNLAGCFIIGVVYSIAERAQLIGPSARLFIMTGFLGGLTTFSTFGLESVNAYRAAGGVALLVNVLLHNICGLTLVGLGMMAARLIR